MIKAYARNQITIHISDVSMVSLVNLKDYHFYMDYLLLDMLQRDNFNWQSQKSTDAYSTSKMTLHIGQNIFN